MSSKFTIEADMRADRLLRIIILLQTRGKLTTRALADEVGVSRRTILRDVDAISMAGVPLYAEGGHGGGVALDENYRTTLTGLTEDEVRALFVLGNGKLLADVGLGDAAESTLLKLLAALPAAHQPSATDIRQRILIDPQWWWHESQPSPFWQALQEAVYDNRRIRCRYENYSGQTTERVLEPYSLVAKASLWYLVARQEDEFRTFRPSRFQDVVLLPGHFERDPSFDLEAYWREHVKEFLETAAMFSFTLRVHRRRLGFVQSLVPGRHQIIGPEDSDGWSVIRLQLDSPELAQMLVFGLGGDGTIIEPEELRESVRTMARELLTRELTSSLVPFSTA